MRHLRFMAMLLVAATLVFTACEGENSGGDEAVQVAGITLDRTDADIEKSKNTPLQLAATVTPANATNKEVRWTSSDETVATVDATGLVTAVDFGSATIIASTKDSGLVASCNITVSYALRDTGPAGGWIFSKVKGTDGGWKYLEAAPVSTEWSDKQWGKSGTRINNTGIAIGTGMINTIYIVAVLNAPTAETDRAAQLCNNLSCGGYDDWYLPSKDELNQMYINLKKGTDENGVTYASVGGFSSQFYWSSSEYDADNAWYQDFNNGYQNNMLKYYPRRVRAVRAF